MQTLKNVILGILALVILTLLFVALQDVPEVRRFTDRAVRILSLVGLGLFVAMALFVIGHRLGASTERSQIANTNSYQSNLPNTGTPTTPQIFMLPPAQTSLPNEVWERPLSSNQSRGEASVPRKVDWSVIS